MSARIFVAVAVLLSGSMLANAKSVQRTADPAPAAAVQSVTVVGKTYKLAPTEFDIYQSAYLLGNGEKIVFSRRVNRYFGQISQKHTQGPLLELSPLAPGKFVAQNGAEIEFQEEGDLVIVTNPDLFRYPHVAHR